MKGKKTIRFIRRKDIDVARWDASIAAASNGLIYAYTNYLDGMCETWDALINEDYSCVMPLPWRKKWNIQYLYQPFLTAQLGLFGNDINEVLLEDFLKSVPSKFRYWDFSLNHQNLFSTPQFPLYGRSNYILSLQPSYEMLSRGYRENIRRNIKKSQQYGCSAARDIAVDEIISLARLQANDATDKEFQNFRNVFAGLQKKGCAKTYGITSNSGQLLASCVFFFSHKRAYYILVGNHPNGRTLGASHALIDAFIQDHAEQDLLLDFEGSDIRNLAFFYSSFGATEEKYGAIKRNLLPWWAKWLKD